MLSEMIAREFVETLVERFGVPIIEARAVDRSLAVAGLREKGRGTNAPQMTRPKGLRVILGLMASRTLSREPHET